MVSISVGFRICHNTVVDVIRVARKGFAGWGVSRICRRFHRLQYMSSSTSVASSQFTIRITQDNPSGMTLSRSNTYLTAAPGADTAVVVDPGYASGADAHAEAVAEALGERTVELMLITHHHMDHTGAIDTFNKRFNAPVRAVQQQWTYDAAPLVVGEVKIG